MSTDKKRRKLDPTIVCFVPSCKNIAWKCPDKNFFHVPTSTRKEWCAAVNKKNVPKSTLYICEDHLNLQEDLLNYNDFVFKHKRPRLKPQVPTNLKSVHDSSVPSCSWVLGSEDSTSNDKQEKWVMCAPEYCTKSLQVQPLMMDCATNTTFKCFKVEQPSQKKTRDSFIYTAEVEEEEENTNTQVENPSLMGTTSEFTESDTTSSLQTQMKSTLSGQCFMLRLIEKKPFEYIGVTKEFYYLISKLSVHYNMPTLHIIVTLYKIKNNETFSRISDLFEISLASLWRIFHKVLKQLRCFFVQFIYWPSALRIKQNLPTAFRTSEDFSNVQGIIDTFEIEIEKPKKPTDQALTWSSYKHCNTIKYLIGSTPDGFINFVSEGFGGRTSDMKVVDHSGFLEVVPSNAMILADRGFKHLESHLAQKSVKVLRPPSVQKDCKLTKAEAIDTKVIASLRIHIERVIRRVRLFKILKPHSVVNSRIVNVLDDAVIVACGLINLQASVIKKL